MMARIEMLYTLAGGLKKGTTFFHDLVKGDPIHRLIEGGFARILHEDEEPMVAPAVVQAQPVPAPRVPDAEPDGPVPAEPEPAPAQEDEAVPADETKDTTDATSSDSVK